jgi:hypothetical protein
MEIEAIFTQILDEQVENKKLFSALMQKWRTEKPDLTDEQGEKLFFRFQEIKNALNPKLPQVASFLSRFDGQFGYDTFNPDYLKDITKYTYRQIKSLIDEYTPLEELEHMEDVGVFDPKDTKPTPEKISVSKDLWFGTRDCIINVGGVRVYDIKTQYDAVKFGYFVEIINKQHRGANSPWCVTWRKDQGNTNQWGTYRGGTYQRSFYFVIDENKDPQTDKYFLGALQYSPMIASKFILTSVKNDGDNSRTWSEISEIYPPLKDFKDLIKGKPYSDAELKEQSVVGRITETPGPFEFRRQEPAMKRAFLNNGGILQNPLSWVAMSPPLKQLYITATNAFNAISRFSNYQFLNEIRKVGSDWTLLNNRLKALGFQNGVGAIFAHLIKNDYKPGRISINNPNIVIYISKTDGKFGIFDLGRGDWYRMGSTTYEPIYTKIRSQGILDHENKPYLLEIFGINNTEDDSSFYSIFPVTGISAKSYLLSYDGFMKLTEKMSDVENRGKKSQQMQDFKPDTDVDIKEIKGV